MIPGARFDTFLNDIVFFLKAHPTEIVVIRTCADGIKVCEVPNSDVITQFAVRALQGSDITLGDRSSFQKSVASLRASGTRLILVQNNPKCDSYSDNAYATLDAKTIISSFAGMNQASQKDKDFTVLQCQVEKTHFFFFFVELMYVKRIGNLDFHQGRPRLRGCHRQQGDLPTHVYQGEL